MHVQRTALAILMTSALVACGGGGGGGGVGGGPIGPTPGAQTGVFVDAPVVGLAYTCGDDSGTTDASGQFRFDSGDTCVFRAGSISLGSLLAQATITPRDVAAALAAAAPAGSAQSVDVIAQNIYQLLQSLDADGDTSNGITLPNLSGVTFDSDLTNPLTLLNLSAEDFQAQVSSVVDTIVAAQPNLPIAVVSVDAALEHAVEQAQVLLAGTWIVSGDALSRAVTFLPNGTYLFGGQSDDDQCVDDVNGVNVDEGGNGAEYARFEWNPLNGDFRVTEVLSDSTGTCGLSNFEDESPTKLQVVGSTLRLDVYDTDNAQTCVQEGGADATDLEGNRTCRYILTRALGTAPLNSSLGSTRGLEGSYILESDLAAGIASVLTIEQTGTNAYRYLLTESYGNGNTPDSEGATNGIAIGTFTVGANAAVTFTETLNTIGGDGGFGGQAGTLALRLDASRNLEFDDEDTDPYVYVRLPLAPRLSQANVVGTYFPRELNDDGVTLDTQATENFPAFVTLFDNGEFLIGTNEDDTGCEADSSLINTQPLCDGIEYGRYTLDTLTGEVLFQVQRAESDPPFVDSNGTNGLVNDGTPRERFFLRRLPADGELLLVGIAPMDLATSLEDTLIEISGVTTVAQAIAFTEADPDARFFLVLRPVVSTAGSLEGAWQVISLPANDGAIREDGSVAPVVIVFQNSDEFFVSHPSGVETYDGIEFGNYRIDGGNTLCVTAFTVDTLPDAGLIPDSPELDVNGCLSTIPFAFNAQTDRFVLDEGTEAATFKRISKASVAATQ